MSPPAGPVDELRAEFDCGCSVELSREWSLSLWQCTAGESCPSWRVITEELRRSVRLLRIHALVPPAGPGPGAGGSL